MSKKESKFFNLHAGYKLAICLIAAIVVYLTIDEKTADRLSAVMIAWNTFSFLLLVIDWYFFLTTPIAQIRAKAKREDAGSVLVSIIVLVSAFLSLLAVIVLILSKNENTKLLHIITAIAGMTFSWLLIHTIFAIRYAHLYYSNHPTKKDEHAGGLEFPEEEDKPDFFDFAYFSFVLGMTFQVSDVQITSKVFRRLALLHGFLSFVYNTAIVALTINVLAGLGQK